MAELQPIEVLGAGGIDQSDKAAQNAVYDACNVDSSQGFWRLRPGIKAFGPTSPFSGVTNMMAEYIADLSYSSSIKNTLVVGCSDNGTQKFYEVSNAAMTPLVLSSAASMPAVDDGDYKRYSVVQHLWRYTRDGAARYAPVLVMSNGVDRPLVYHQDNNDGTPVGVGKLEYLDSIDGGDSGITYLQAPPKGKYLAIYKERLFAAVGNTLFHTGPDPAYAFTCNVWPSGYNLDVGHEDGEITGLKVFQGQLVIFKKNAVYVLSGDGVSGNWSVQKVDGEHGALNGFCVVDAGDSLFFLNKSGIYRWAGGIAQSISHPRLRYLWPKLELSESGSVVPFGLMDVDTTRVMFQIQGHKASAITLVFNILRNTWDRWGAWLAEFDDRSNYQSRPGIPEWSIVVKNWDAKKNMVMGVFGSGFGVIGGGKLAVLSHGVKDTRYTTQIVSPFHWFIKTNRYFADDSYIKLLRHMVVLSRKTGDWKLSLLAHANDESFAEALQRNIGVYDTIVKQTNANPYDIAGTNKTSLTLSGEDVSVTSLVTGYSEDKTYDAALPTGAEILFSAGDLLDCRYDKLGTLISYERDRTPMRFVTMYNDDDSLYNSSGGATYADNPMSSPTLEKVNKGTNTKGRHFSLWMSNVGAVRAANAVVTTWAVAGMPFEIHGWGMWIIPTPTLRPGVS